MLSIHVWCLDTTLALAVRQAIKILYSSLVQAIALDLQWRVAKANVVSKHQTWIDSITKQTDQLKIGLKAYRYLSEGIELASELGIELDEAELVRTNSTGLTIYNPSNLASMIKGMKNKNQTREDKIKARLQYEKQSIN